MNGLLLVILLSILAHVYSLFPNQPDSKFQVNIAPTPKKIVFSYDGASFVTWSNNTVFYVYQVNGDQICNGSLGDQILQVYWPRQKQPMFLTYPAFFLRKVNPFTCKKIEQWQTSSPCRNGAIITRDNFLIFNFIYYDQNQNNTLQPYMQQQNLSIARAQNSYSVSSSVRIIVDIVYSVSLKFLYASEIMADASRRIEIFNATSGKSLNFTYVNEAMTSMYALEDQSGIIVLGTNINGTNNIVYRFDNSGKLTKIAQRSNIKKIAASSQAGVIILLKADTTEIEVISIKDGRSIQKMSYFPKSSSIAFDLSIKKTRLIAVDNEGNFITSTYQIPPEQQDSSLPLWIILSIGGGILLIVTIGGIIFRKKIMKCIKKQKQPGSIKQSLISKDRFINQQADVDDRIERPVEGLARQKQKNARKNDFVPLNQQQVEVNNANGVMRRQFPQRMEQIVEINRMQRGQIQIEPQNQPNDNPEPQRLYDMYMDSIIQIQNPQRQPIPQEQEEKLDWRKVGYDLINKDDIIRAAYDQIKDAPPNEKLQKLKLFKELVVAYLKREKEEAQIQDWMKIQREIEREREVQREVVQQYEAREGFQNVIQPKRDNHNAQFQAPYQVEDVYRQIQMENDQNIQPNGEHKPDYQDDIVDQVRDQVRDQYINLQQQKEQKPQQQEIQQPQLKDRNNNNKPSLLNQIQQRLQVNFGNDVDEDYENMQNIQIPRGQYLNGTPLNIHNVRETQIKSKQIQTPQQKNINNYVLQTEKHQRQFIKVQNTPRKISNNRKDVDQSESGGEETNNPNNVNDKFIKNQKKLKNNDTLKPDEEKNRKIGVQREGEIQRKEEKYKIPKIKPQRSQQKIEQTQIGYKDVQSQKQKLIKSAIKKQNLLVNNASNQIRQNTEGQQLPYSIIPPESQQPQTQLNQSSIIVQKNNTLNSPSYHKDV